MKAWDTLHDHTNMRIFAKLILFRMHPVIRIFAMDHLKHKNTSIRTNSGLINGLLWREKQDKLE